MAKPWGGAGAWAAEAERAEAEEKEKKARSIMEEESFPSLMESVTNKTKKKNKSHTISLSELQSGKHVGPGGRNRGGAVLETKGLTPEEMMILPTGPRERTGDESEYGGIGGGFRDYGRGSRGFGRDRDEGRKPYGGFEDDRRPARDQGPSRADEADSWGRDKKFQPQESFERRRYEDRGDRFESSRADEAQNWGAGKKFVPDRRSMGFGSGYRDSGMDSERWSRRETDRDDPRPTDRPRLVLNPIRSASSTPAVVNPAAAEAGDAPKPSKQNPFGSARPREEVLAEKGQDWRKLDLQIEGRDESRHSSRPSSSHSSRPGSPSSQSEAVVPKPRPKINPFGDAKPREVLLAEKGKDWRKIDFELEHRRVDRPETEDEILLKKELNSLKIRAKEIENEEVVVNGKTSDQENQMTLSNQITNKEKELELLIRELDDKVRFGQRGGDRPGSASGRSFESFERPGSQSGRSDSGKNYESFERPRSRGREGAAADIWMRSGDERRGMYGNKDRSFGNFTNRERADSRSRW